MLLHEDLTRSVIGAAIEVHSHLGPGLLESIYEECLCHELMLRGMEFRQQVELPIVYKSATLDTIYRIDLIIEDTLIVEVKAIEQMLPVHEAQLLTYLRLTGKRIGLLLNFNVPALMDGILRRIL